MELTQTILTPTKMTNSSKKLAYDLSFEAFKKSINKVEVAEGQTKVWSVIENMMANAYAMVMVATEGDQKESVRFVNNLFTIENIKKMIKASENQELVDSTVSELLLSL
jgi:vacuolar-type H+-ATPase subunit C/Vma6